MKKLHTLFLFLSLIFFTSCEDVIPVDLDTAPPKLVVEAIIKWEKGTDGKNQKIKLTTTASYFSNQIPVVSGATISIKNSSNTIFNFTEIGATGEYMCSNFVPVINETYTLTILHNGNTYTATETLKSVAPIEEVTQKNDGGFTGTDIQIKTFYTDPANEVNYYLYQYSYNNQILQNFYADEDSYFQGNRFFSLSQKDNLKAGDQVTITHYGISKSYYNYMNILISIAGGGGGGPFQAPPATVRGNIINTTDKNNYALGYFTLNEIDTKTYTIQ
ncbi:DUF4249 domain-containing protein [Flavobacterium sp. UMI-01]|uniref:DUF4249 domain-containing protein n=1 Tax=Flavobacterium sp. UMI-01 TaxID=1441053 RepID=UPI001C7CD8C2|nr:DUF4249 domain-containing protein [Flavobacterium sp. UMI-01]GIZ10110.1 hypothetical protein FUMI01_28360 [Flavobacterium sp. UMI-01]